MNVTQDDRQIVAACIVQGVSHPAIQHILNGDKDEWFFVQAFAAHRQAALLEGVQIGLEAAMKAINAKCEHSQNNRGWAYVDVSNLDPAAVLAKRGGV